MWTVIAGILLIAGGLSGTIVGMAQNNALRAQISSRIFSGPPTRHRLAGHQSRRGGGGHRFDGGCADQRGNGCDVSGLSLAPHRGPLPASV